MECNKKTTTKNRRFFQRIYIKIVTQTQYNEKTALNLVNYSKSRHVMT